MSTSTTRSPPASASRPRSRFRPLHLAKRLAQLTLLLLGSAVMSVIGWVHSDDFQRRAVTLVETVVEELSGEACTVTRVRVNFWPPGVEVDGFHLFDPVVGDTIVSTERIRVPLVLREGAPRIGRLTLQRPVIQLHVEADGKLRELRNVKQMGDPNNRRPLRQLPWRSVEIVDGAFRLSFPDGHLKVEGIDLTPVDPGHGDLSADIELVYRDLTERTRLELPAIAVGPHRIEIPEVALDTRPIALSGRAAWPLTGDLDVDLTARVDLEPLNPLLAPPRAIHGAVDLDVRIEGPPADPRAEIAVLSRHVKLEVPGVFTPVLHYDIGSVAAAAVADRREVLVQRATLFVGEHGHLTAQGRITLDDKRLHDGHVVGDRVSLAHLLRAFDAAPTPWVDMSADAEISVAGGLHPLALEGHFELAVASLRVGDRPIAAPGVQLMLDIPKAWARGTLQLEKDHIFLSAPTVEGPRSRGSATIDIGFGPRGPLALDADLYAADLADFQPLNGVELAGEGRITGQIFGPFNGLQVVAEGDMRDFAVMGIPYADHLTAHISSPDMKQIVLTDAVAIRGETPYSGDFAMDFRSPLSMDTTVDIGAGRVEDLVGMFIDLPGLKGALNGGSLRLEGPLLDMTGEAHLDLGESELWGERFHSGEAHGYMDEGLFTLNDLRVLRHDGREGLLLRGSVERQWALDMELMGDGLALERLDWLRDQPDLAGNLAVHSRITGTLFDPSPDGRLALTDVRYDGQEVADSLLTFDTTDGVMAYSGALLGRAARVEGTLGLWGEQPYAAHIELDRVPAHLLYPIGADGKPIEAVASGTLDLSGHFGEAWSPVTLRAELPDVEMRYGHHVLRNDAPWLYEQDGNRFRLHGFNLAGGRTQLRLNASGGEALLLGGEGTVELDLLRAIVPGLQRANGQADVVLYAVGAKPHVEAVVELDVRADLLRHESVPASFEDLTARIRLTDGRFDIEAVDAGIGGGTLKGSGTVDATDWIPTRYDLQVAVEDAQVQWVASLPPAIGDARLRFDGPVDALLLHGRVTVNEMSFSDRIDWEDWVVEYREEMLVDPTTAFDAESWFNLNIEIGAKRTIFLRNNVAEGLGTAELRVIGDTARPGLVGSVRLEEGIAFLQDRQFRIERGNLLFNDPWTWDPELDLQLVTDIDNRRQRYRVNYMVMGPFSDWRTASRSDPPLPQADVNALLWFGLTTDELEEMGGLSTAVAQGVADLILSDFLITNQAGEFADELPEFLFDRIDLATGVNGRGEYSAEPRLLVEKRLDDLGNVDLRWEFNLVRPEDNYVRAQKRIGGIWSLSGWYASLQRDRVLPIGGAYGVDVTARWEIE